MQMSSDATVACVDAMGLPKVRSLASRVALLRNGVASLVYIKLS